LSDVAEMVVRLNRLAKLISRMFGTDIEVEESGDRLVFIDPEGEALTLDGEEIIAATPEEIANQSIIGHFPARAFRAAGIAKYQEVARSRVP
jgi:hypothetical protein